MFLTLEDAYGLYECVCFESKLAKIAPVVARASYFLVRGRLQNNHKRGLAIVAEEVLDLEEVLARRRARHTPMAASAVATAAQTQSGGRTQASKVGKAQQALPAIPDAIDMIGRREPETYGDGTASAKKRPPGAGTTAIPKKVG